MDSSMFRNLNWFLYFCVFSAELLVLSYGMALGWTSPAIPILYSKGGDNPFPEPITRQQEAWIMGLLSLGACFGPPFADVLIHRFGRKKIMVLAAAVVGASFLLTAFAPSIEYCLAARFLLGVGGSFVLIALPIYIAEIVETSSRGAYGCIFGIMLAVGMSICYAVGGSTDFRVFTIICAAPSILCLFIFGLFAPESPYYYMSHENTPAALESLNKLRTNQESVDQTLLEIMKYIQESNTNKGGYRELLDSKRGKRGLVICGGAMIFQQLTGLTIISASVQSILDATNSGISANITTVFISVINLVVNIASSQMADRLGRKALFIISSVGCMIFLTMLATYFYLQNDGYGVKYIWWLPVVSMTGYFVAVGLGLGSLPWAITAEMFPSNLKELCSALTVTISLSTTFVATFSYPYIKSAIGYSAVFYMLAAFSGLSILFFAYVLPETKGKTFEEIQIMLDD